MKALFVYQYLTLGGVESVIGTRQQGLAAHGVEAAAWFLEDRGGRGMLSQSTGRVWIGDGHAVRKELDRGRFDLISVIDTPSVIPQLASFSVPMVVECHTPYRENQRYLRNLTRGTVEAVLVPSRHQADVVGRWMTQPVPVRVVRNSVAAQFFGPIVPIRPVPPRPVVAWIGRLDSLKNWVGFLSICQQALRETRDFEVWIVGSFPDGSAWPQLYRQAKKRRLLPHLRWYRSFPHKRIPHLLDAVRSSGGVVVSSSKGESFGMTVAEAMARACPVLVPREAPFTEFIDLEKSGLGYPAGDSELASAELVRLLKDSELRNNLGVEGRKQISGNYSPGVTLPGLAKVLGKYVKTES